MDKLKLINVSQIMKYKKNILLVDDEIIIIESNNNAIYKILQLLSKGISVSTLKSNKEFDNVNINELIDLLKENGILKKYTPNKYKGHFIEKQWTYFDSLIENDANICQENIEKSVVCIIGLGGVGTVIIDSLMRAGVRNFILVDCDNVSITNLNRQIMYGFNDIGKRKTSCIKKKILEFSKEISVEIFDKKILNSEDLLFLDNYPISMIVNAADKPNNINELIYTYAENKNIAVCSGAVGRNQGSWGPMIIPQKTISYKNFLRKELLKMHNFEKFIYKNSSTPMDVSFGPYNAIISQFLSKDIIMYLSGHIEKIYSYEKRCGIDFNTMSFL